MNKLKNLTTNYIENYLESIVCKCFRKFNKKIKKATIQIQITSKKELFKFVL